MPAMIISGVIYGLAALFMIGIGISQVKSQKPVTFYTGEKPPAAEELSDVRQWNLKHGIMWIAYGVIIILSWGCGCLLGGGTISVLPLIAGITLPLVVMIWYHHRLIKRYKIK